MHERFPTVSTKPYKIDFLFDGKTFHVAPASREAAKLFTEP